MFMFLISLFYTGAVSEIKKLCPGTVLVTGKPHHSELNEGVEKQNWTVEKNISNWMHYNNPLGTSTTIQKVVLQYLKSQGHR